MNLIKESGNFGAPFGARFAGLAVALASLAGSLALPAYAGFTCERQVTANLVAFDKPIMYNRLGAGNVNGMMFALKRDVINNSTQLPLTAGGAAVAGQLDLRPDKRHRPRILCSRPDHTTLGTIRRVQV